MGLISKSVSLLLNPRATVPLLIVATGWGVFHYLLPEKKELDESRRELALDTVNKITSELPRTDGMEKALVLPLENDPTGEVTGMLRSSLDSTGMYQVLDRPTLDRILNDLHLPERRAASLEEARKMGETGQARFVFSGEVRELSNLQDRRRCEIALAVIDTTTSGLALRRTWTSEAGTLAALGGGSSGGVKVFLLKTLLLFFFVIALPVITFKLVQIVVAQESNAVNLFMLIGYTVADLLFAFFLMGFDASSASRQTALALVVIAAFWLNYKICDRIEALGR
ncbi:MAG: hypothetical protein HUU16_19915 [Candidatus Omnitrophica bacterium]|nr:hypothetical protein [bacterium]NUN98432.1 hypothetical protein [Candidatus Omnitrophota bacterium]